jgi:zinc protease
MPSLRRRASLLTIAALVCLLGRSGRAQAPGGAAAPDPRARSLGLADQMPFDAAIARATLPNGLRYYVRANPKPEQRAELRLVVRAGSILEEDDQQGLAHFVEHMAFNGTRHFPRQETIAFLQSLGMRFGADVNASTGFDETVYMLTVPTDKPGALDRALLILEDWAHDVTFDPAAIDKEREVITEEWRLRRGAGARIQDRILPTLLNGSRYAERIPIGQMDVVQHFKPERLRQFYEDWYRPDLMAVVAVGDFDAARTEALVKQHFSGLKNPTSERPRPAYGVPDRDGTIYAIQVDKEMPVTTVESETILPARPEGTVGAYRQKIVDVLFASMMNARLAELTQKADAPFVNAGAGRSQYVTRAKDSASISAFVRDGGAERGLEAILGEAERASRFGFTASELDRQKQTVLRSVERSFTEKDNRVSASRAQEYIRNFLTGESLPKMDDEFVLHQRFLPEITLDELNRLPKEWFGGTANRHVILTAPDKPGVTLPDQARLASIVAAAPSRELAAYVDRVSGTVLLEKVPEPGRVAKTSAKDALGVTEWELSNGVKVVLKPTTFRQDEIVFRAFSAGGTSLASDADYIPASTASQLIGGSGVGKYPPPDLRRLLTGKIASANPFISELDEGLSGSASPRDLETMFQLIYMRFVEPRADPGAVAAQAAQLRAVMANMSNSPGFVFAQTLAGIMGNSHPRRRVDTVEAIDQWNLDKSYAFYKDRFADASAFTFVFVGTFDPDTIRPFVERYLASLPSIRRTETWKDVGARYPTGVITKQVEKGLEPKSQAALVYTGPFVFDQTQRIAIRAMSEILQNRLRETIREQLGGTYSINANANYRPTPVPDYTISIGWGCDPARLDELVARVLKEIDALKSDGPTAQQVADEREALLRDYESVTKQNAWWVSQMAQRYENHEDPAGLLSLPDYYRKIDAAMIQQAARTYLKGDNRVQVTLVPEKKAGS